jgi:hypothetical protein
MWRANASRETNYTHLHDAHEENEAEKRRSIAHHHRNRRCRMNTSRVDEKSCAHAVATRNFFDF